MKKFKLISLILSLIGILSIHSLAVKKLISNGNDLPHYMQNANQQNFLNQNIN